MWAVDDDDDARIILGAERTTRTLTMFDELIWIPFFIEAYI